MESEKIILDIVVDVQKDFITGALANPAAQANVAHLADTAKATTLANASTEQGEKYKIEGTPTFIINGAKLDANTWPLVKAELEKLGAR